MNTLINKETLEEYYPLTKSWLADCNFFESELNFFKKLIKKNIVFSVDDKYLVKLQQNLTRLNDLVTEKRNIQATILEHMKELKKAISNTLPHEAEEIYIEHEMLRKRMMAFINSYRLYKKQLYHAAEMLTGDTELDLLLSSKTIKSY